VYRERARIDYYATTVITRVLRSSRSRKLNFFIRLISSRREGWPCPATGLCCCRAAKPGKLCNLEEPATGGI